MAYGLIETLFRRESLAQTVKPVIQQWLKDLAQKLRDLDFQDNIHVIGYNRENPWSGGCVYVDPQGERTAETQALMFLHSTLRCTRLSSPASTRPGPIS